MGNSNGHSVEVRVFDYRRQPLPEARATLTSLDGQGQKKLRLRYDRARGVYRLEEVPAGRYVIEVKARSYETDERQLVVRDNSLSEVFILGKRGMPFYYRGKVKVPFRRQDDLVGIATRGLTEGQQQSLVQAVRRLGLEPVDLDRTKIDTNIFVYRVPARISTEALGEAITSIRRRQEVAHAGRVIEMGEEAVAFLTNEIVVKFKAGVSTAEVAELASAHGLAILRRIPYSENGYQFSITDEAVGYEVLDLCTLLVATGKVEYAEPNLVISTVDDQVVPTDFLYTDQWHLPMIKMEEAWQVLRDRNAPATGVGDAADITFGSHAVIIGVMDRGIESQTTAGIVAARHADFSGTVSNGASKVYRFFDFATMSADNDNPPSDHGMGVAGVAAAIAENPSVVAGETEGAVGAAPNCRVIGIIRPAGGTETQYADAYYWAAGFDPNSSQANFPAQISPGADIITNSFGAFSGSAISGIMSDCFDDLTSNGRGGKGVVLFFSVGNGDTTLTLQRPWAAYDKTIAVAASTDADVRATYSNFGPEVDVCAPSSNGTGITSCDLIGDGNVAGHTGGGLDYRDSFGGTSSATPLVAGLAALMLTADPFLAWSDVRDILRRTAVKIDFANTDPTGQWVDNNGDGQKEFSQWYGYGRVDAEAAVREASLLFAAQVLDLVRIRKP